MASSRQGKRNKERGYEFEKEIESLAIALGLEQAWRTWGSDGQSRGLPENVDIELCEKAYLQCKRQKTKVSKRYIPDPNILAQVIRGDRQDPVAVMDAGVFLKLIAVLAEHELLELVTQEL